MRTEAPAELGIGMGRIVDLVAEKAGVKVEDGCWIYRDAENGTVMKVGRPGEVVAFFEGLGERMYFLDGGGVDEKTFLCVHESWRRWEVTGFLKSEWRSHLGDFVVYSLPMRFEYVCGLHVNGDNIGFIWRVYCPEGNGASSQEDRYRYYKRLAGRLGMGEPSVVRRLVRRLKRSLNGKTVKS